MKPRHSMGPSPILFSLLVAGLCMAMIDPALASAQQPPACDDGPMQSGAATDEDQASSPMSQATARTRLQTGLIRTANGDTGVLIHTGDGPGHAGPALQIIEVSSGALLANFSHPELVDAVLAEVTAVDTQADGYTDRILFGDSGGKLWRADIDPAASRHWSAAQPALNQGLTPLARFGRHGRDGRLRQIDQAPDLVPGRDGLGDFDAVIVSAREAAEPGAQGNDQAWLLMIKDRRTGIIAAQPDAPVLHIEDLALVDPECPDISRCQADMAASLAQGWALQLSSPGERVLATPISYGGVVHVATRPAAHGVKAACSSASQTLRLYAIDLMSGHAAARHDDPEAPAFIDIETTGRSIRGLLPTPDRLLATDPRFDETRPGIWLRTYWQFEEASLD